MIKSIDNFAKAGCLCSLLLLVLFMAGCRADAPYSDNAGLESSVTAAENAEISSDDAKQLALKDAGVNENDVTYTELKTDYEDGIQVYEVKFYTSNAEYEYEIRVSDGSIYSRDIEYFNTGQRPEHVNDVISAEQDKSATTGSSGITMEAAKQTALMDAGISEADATFTEAVIDYESGRQVYELKFYTADAEYEYEIDASDGTVYSKDIEYYCTYPQNNGQQDIGSQIDIEKAKAIALEHAGADMQDVTFKEAKTDRDDGIDVYEIEFYYLGKEYEFKIRCSDGSIMEYDID